MNFLHRLSVAITRYRKRRLTVWIGRWERANRHCWLILAAGHPTKARLNRFDRHHRKLTELAKRRVKSFEG